MYTAKVIEKSDNGTLVIGVEFTNGIDTRIENVTPQDKKSFERWVKSRLDALNSLVTLEKEVKVDDMIDPFVVEPEPTQAEKELKVWLRKVNRLGNIKVNLIDTGVFTGVEKPIQNLRDDIKATFKPAYVDEL